MTFNWRYSFNIFQTTFHKLSQKKTDRQPEDCPCITDINDGLRTLFGSASTLNCKTVIVLGSERGGTSMVAGSLEKLGIYMGDTISAVYEDPEFAHFLKTNDRAKAKRLIASRNINYAIWGLKKPSTLLYTYRWVKLFRNPVFVVVFRDAMAVANRRSVSRNANLADSIDDTLTRYRDMFRFINRIKRPSLLISYEKALLNPSIYIDILAEFLGIGIDASTRTDCINFIQPSPEAYRRASTCHEGWFGALERVRSNKIVGWAFRKNQPEPVKVILALKNGITLEAIANISRKDVQEYHKHVSEFAGFEISLPNHLHLTGGDTVSICIKGENADLNNSPHIYSDNGNN